MHHAVLALRLKMFSRAHHRDGVVSYCLHFLFISYTIQLAAEPLLLPRTASFLKQHKWISQEVGYRSKCPSLLLLETSEYTDIQKSLTALFYWLAYEMHVLKLKVSFSPEDTPFGGSKIIFISDAETVLLF